MTRDHLPRVLDEAWSPLQDGRAAQVQPDAVLSALVGSSAANAALKQRIGICAGTDAPVLVSGESGTELELVARLVHDASHRSQKPFETVDCVSWAPGVLRHVLFGYASGALSLGTREQRGVFKKAHRGTVFLGEVSELGSDCQRELLAALRSHVVHPSGSKKAISVDVRIIAATTRDLRNECRVGRFRLDLYDRLVALSIHVPSLRERSDDIAELAHRSLCKAIQGVFAAPPLEGPPLVRLSDDAIALLRAQDWPGNDRQLELVMMRIAVAIRSRFVEIPLRIEVSAQLLRQALAREASPQPWVEFPPKGRRPHDHRPPGA